MKIVTALMAAGLLFSATSSVQADVYIDGFLQTLHGARLNENNPTATEMTASETRLQLRAEHFGDGGEFFGRLDFVYDGVDTAQYDWELREGYLKFSMGQNFDFKLGRQILTWGTGDLLFINDVFAKDYRSFFIGRDDQYLKAPQNSMRVDYYLGANSISLVWTPIFEPNRLPTGRKLSFFNGQQIVGEGFSFDPPTPEAKFENGEFAARLDRTLLGYSTVLYFYKGFYKAPMGVEMTSTGSEIVPIPIYPELNLYGASVRGPLAGGIVWLETGYFDSRQDQKGDNPLMPNSQITGLIGFERQVATNLTMNAQWQAESMDHYECYRVQKEAAGLHVRDKVRHLLTSRITKLMVDELLTLSAFWFYSPTDEDGYGRFSASYKHSDEITLALGGNLFWGEQAATEFGQLQWNDNVYLKVTYGF